MKTAGGVELDLKLSKYSYSFHNFTFYFSSNFYLEKFKNNVEDYIFLEKLKLKNRYKIYIVDENKLILSYYMKIEKRGFFIQFNNEDFFSYNIFLKYYKEFMKNGK